MTKKQIREVAKKHAFDALSNRASAWTEYEQEGTTVLTNEEIYAVANEIMKYAPKIRKLLANWPVQ
jgi:hypothetical protein